jgi:hypothetical protein
MSFRVAGVAVLGRCTRFRLVVGSTLPRPGLVGVSLDAQLRPGSCAPAPRERCVSRYMAARSGNARVTAAVRVDTSGGSRNTRRHARNIHFVNPPD